MSATAELARQKGQPSVQDLERAAEGINVNKFLVDQAGAHGLKVDFAQSITAGHIERTIEGASVINVSIHDGTKAILRSGMFGTKDNKKIPVLDVLVDGLWFRLVHFRKEGEELTLE